MDTKKIILKGKDEGWVQIERESDNLLCKDKYMDCKLMMPIEKCVFKIKLPRFLSKAYIDIVYNSGDLLTDGLSFRLDYYKKDIHNIFRFAVILGEKGAKVIIE